MAGLLGIDVGTTKICGIVATPSGEIAASANRPNDAAVPPPQPGWAEQDPARLRETAFAVVRELTAHGLPIAAVGLTGQMHGMLCVDASNRPASHLITWQDRRCLAPAATQGTTYIDLMRERVAPELWRVCGCTPASGYLAGTLFWMLRNAALPRAAARVACIQDWLAGLLTEQLPVTDPSDAGSSGIFDLVGLHWHEEIVSRLGLPGNLLPPVRPPGEIIGRMSPAAAAETGLPAGTPVCNAIGDNPASVLGSVADIDRSVSIHLGTGGQISWAVPEFVRISGMETRFLPPDRHMLVGASLCGGRAYAWLNDVVRAWHGALLSGGGAGGAPERDYVYARLNELAAAAPPGSAGLRVTTTLAGTRSDPERRGWISGISLENFTLGNLARAVLAGIIEELCDWYERAAGERKRQHETVVASGNAVRKNPLLRGLIAERFGRRVLVPRHAEEAAFGAALLAGVAAGVWPDLAAAGRCVSYAADRSPASEQ